MKFFQKIGVCITGVGQLKIEKESGLSMREMGAKAVLLAIIKQF